MLLTGLGSSLCLAQECIPDLKTEVKNARGGLQDGSVTFKLASGADIGNRYLIFEVTAKSDPSGRRVPVSNGLMEHLAAGSYEFLVIDRRDRKCFKEILVYIKEQQSQQ